MPGKQSTDIPNRPHYSQEAKKRKLAIRLKWKTPENSEHKNDKHLLQDHLIMQHQYYGIHYQSQSVRHHHWISLNLSYKHTSSR